MHAPQDDAREAVCQTLRILIAHREVCIRGYDDTLSRLAQAGQHLADTAMQFIQGLRDQEARRLAKERARLFELSATEATIRLN